VSTLVLEVIKGRRSVRSFKPDPIPEEHLKLILEAGLWAPSGGNAQPWEFVLVREKQVIDKIRLFSPGLFGDPYALIVLCVNKNRIKRRDESGKQIALMDVAMAAQNMMLEAYYLGVGSCPIASFNKTAIKELLDMPDHVDPVLMVSLGYPEKWPEPPKRRPFEEVVHYEKY
jgi:nitroreductase